MIDNISGGVKAFDPINRRKRGLKEQGPDNVINGAKSAFNTAILWGCVGARHSKGDTMGEEERAGGGVVELTSIIALHALDGATELSGDVREKIGEGGKSIGFKTKWERPSVVGAIIKNY